MKRPKLAKRYAKALFEFAEEQNRLERVCSDIELVNQAMAESKDLQFVISSPIVHKSKKSAIVRQIFEPHLDELTLRYLFLLLKKGRELQIDQICHEFHELYKQYRNIITLYIESAASLDKETIDSLKTEVETATHAIAEVVEVIHPTMIGGVRLRFNDYLLDASVKGNIDRLRRELVDKSYQINF